MRFWVCYLWRHNERNAHLFAEYNTDFNEARDDGAAVALRCEQITSSLTFYRPDANSDTPAKSVKALTAIWALSSI